MLVLVVRGENWIAAEVDEVRHFGGGRQVMTSPVLCVCNPVLSVTTSGSCPRQGTPKDGPECRRDHVGEPNKLAQLHSCEKGFLVPH